MAGLTTEELDAKCVWQGDYLYWKEKGAHLNEYKVGLVTPDQISDGCTGSLPDGSTDRTPEGGADSNPDGCTDRVPDGSTRGLPERSNDRAPDGATDANPDGSTVRVLDSSTDRVPDGSTRSTPARSTDSTPEGATDTNSDDSTVRVPDGCAGSIPGGSADEAPDDVADTHPDGSTDRAPSGSTRSIPDRSTNRSGETEQAREEAQDLALPPTQSAKPETNQGIRETQHSRAHSAKTEHKRRCISEIVCLPRQAWRTLTQRRGRRESHTAFADARRSPTTFGLRATRVGEAKNPGPPTDLDCEIFGTSDAETQREGEDGESRSPVDRPRTPPKQTDTRTVRGQGEANEDGDVGNHLYLGGNQKEKAEKNVEDPAQPKERMAAPRTT